MPEGREIRKKCPNQHKPMGTPACVGVFRDEAGGELSLAAPALCPQHRGWGKAFLNPAGATAGAARGLCTLLAKAAGRTAPAPAWLCQQLQGWQVNKHLQKKPKPRLVER